VPKYKKISTHTARRSAATNMYLASIPTIDIMKITGHKTETIFLNYIKVSKEETAKNLTNHPYYKQPVRKDNEQSPLTIEETELLFQLYKKNEFSKIDPATYPILTKNETIHLKQLSEKLAIGKN
jgi:hypothetical protein